MGNNRATSKIGEVFTTNEGYEATIIAAGSNGSKVVIQIGTWTKEVNYGDIKRGQVGYPLHPATYGKGFIGVGTYLKKNSLKCYETWARILQRVYCPKFHERQPTYSKVTMCEEWHNYQVFAKWFYENYIEGFEIDKDILSDEGKAYSPSTCVFIPKRLNSFLTNKQTANTSGYIGVSRTRNGLKWRASIKIDGKGKNLGVFEEVEDAVDAYKQARQAQVVALQELYKNVLSKEVLDRLW